MIREAIREWIKRLENQETIICGDYELPTKALIDNLHDFLIEHFKAAKNPIKAIGKRTDADLDRILYMILSDFTDGSDFYEELLIKAAHLLNIIVTTHVYNDGNKRTGWTVFILVLYLNKYPGLSKVWLDYENNSEFLTNLAQKGSTNENINLIIDWFKNKLR